MSSEKLASAKDQLKGDLGGSWNILEGSESNYTDLGIARRFGGSAAAYSLRDIGAMNGPVVRVRREPYDDSDRVNDEEKFSANQVQSGTLEDWVNGKLEAQLPADGVAVEVVGGSEVAGKYISRVKYSTDPEILDPVFVYYNDSLTVPLKIIRFSTGTSVRWRFERQSDNVAVIDPTNRGTVYKSPADVPNSDWVGTGNLAITSITKVSQADAAYSLRKVNNDYGAPTTRLDGIDGFPSNLNDLPLGNYNNAISGSTFKVGHFSTNFSAADSVSLSLKNNSFILRAAKATSGAQYGHVIRVKGLNIGKRYTVTGEFKLTKGNGSGTVRMAVDISDATSGTDEKSITTTNSTFTPFEVSALFNSSTADVNFIDFTLNDFGGANAGSGLIEGEFRNIKIVESDNRVARIRRSSDNVEVDVDFDIEGKLSTSSLVGDIAEQGGESGSTRATTLGGFINSSGDFSDFRVDSEWSDNLASFSSVGKTSFSVQAKSLGSFASSDTVRVSAPITNIIAEPQASVTKFKTTFTIDSISGEGNGNDTDGALYVKGANSPSGNGSWHFHNSPDGAGGDETFKFTSAGTYTVEGYGEEETDAYNLAFKTFAFIIYSGTQVSVSNVSMEVLNDCTVHTWYDQTKDLTQLSTYFNDTLSSSNFAVNAMTEEFGTFLGRDNAVKLTSTAGNTQRFDSIDFGIGANESVRFTAQIYVPSTNTALDSFAYSEKFDVGGFDRKQGVITPTQDQWVDIDFNYVQADDTIQRLIFWNSASATPTANNDSDGDVIYFRNMVVTRVAKAQNDAVQETSANQPKIAENGALLADGIEFDGVDDALNFTDLTLTDASIFAVLDIDGTENLQSILGGSSTTTTATMIPMMQTSSTTTQVYKNATVGGAEQGSSQFRNGSQITLNNRGDAYSELATKSNMLFTMLDVDVAADKVLDGISQTPSDATAWGFKGTMEELIIYNSDQSNNRFKIESNINNYYGLYNDANDLTQTEWQNTGAESFSSTSIDGFSYSNSASTSFVGVTLKETLAFGDSVFVSFNASGVTHPDSSDQSPQIRLRDAVGVGDGASDIIQVTNGFNAHTLTYSVSGKSNGDNIVFSEGDTVGGTVTISDFKVSRIARNGFVETWYDQSGNSNDSVQATAPEQPSIVQNGGIVKLNGKPSVNFDGVDNYLTFTNNFNFNLDPTSVSRPINTIMFVGENTAGSRSFLGDEGSSKNWIAAPYNGTYQFRDNGSTIYDTTVSATLGSQLVLSIQCPSEDDFSIRENGSAKTLGGTNNITAAIGIRDIGVGYTLSGSPNYQTMKAQEFYFHNERLPNDIVDIENDAINYYNIS